MKSHKETRRYASVAEAAVYAGVCERTIRRYITDGRIPGYRVGPRLIKVDLNEMDRLIRPIPAVRI